MKRQQLRKRRTDGPEAEVEEPIVHVPATQALSHDLDEILEEIDEILEENAEEFVKGYVQKGGE